MDQNRSNKRLSLKKTKQTRRFKAGKIVKVVRYKNIINYKKLLVRKKLRKLRTMQSKAVRKAVNKNIQIKYCK